MRSYHLALLLPNSKQFLETLAKRERQGKSIPPKWLDSSLQYDKALSSLGLSSKHGSIERAVEQALQSYHKSLTTKKFPLQKILENTQPQRVVFTFENEDIDAVTVKELYDELYKKLEHRETGIEITLTAEQFAEIRPTLTHIINIHGNQALTSAPYLEGGTLNVVFFQWGNLLGVIKYTAAPSEKVVKGDLLTYFEDLQDRTFEQALLGYQKEHQTLIKTITTPELIMPKPIIAPPTIIAEPPTITVPTLSLHLTPSTPWSTTR